MEMKKTLANIRKFHENLSKLTREKEKRCYEYLDDFVDAISRLIEGLEVFPHHITWECMYDFVPEHLDEEEKYVLRNASKKEHRNAPVKPSTDFNYPKDRYFVPALTKKDFVESFRDFFDKEIWNEVFEITLKPNSSYVNLPVFSEYKDRPQWVLTLIYPEENSGAVHDENFLAVMEHVSSQIGLAWDKFKEDIANILFRKTDKVLAETERTRSDSTSDQLHEISQLLSRELLVDWSAFFQVDEEKNALNLEVCDIPSLSSLVYSLDEASNIIVTCATKKTALRLSGRESLEKIVHTEKMKPIEKAIRKYRKQEKLKAGKNQFTPYVFFEHALFSPFAAGDNIKGFFALYRAKKMRQPMPSEQDRSAYETRPFSDFDVFLLRKMRRYVANIFIFHHVLQKRLKDIRNIIDQVVSPISESITATEKFIPRNVGVDITSMKDFFERMRYINALSRITAQYARNFETLLDIDTGKLDLRREAIADLRGYLIDFAKLYTPLIRPKCISINVTKETTSNISIRVDRDLFDLVLSNIIDNALKYSFNPEEREELGLQPKPEFTDDKENVQVTAVEKDHSVTITVSNYGIEITAEEKERIFDREFRGIQAPDRAKGTGIGLFVPKEIIEKHGGTIELIKGTEKHNTIFKIRLPKSKSQPISGGDKR